MITTPQEFYENLHIIQNKNFPEIAKLLPSTETIYNIDLNTREVDAPEYLSVQYDHFAETIYFTVDRYFDNMDLAQTTCVIQYVNANGEGRIYPVPFYDVTTFDGKILFPWCIDGEATKVAGNVKYAIRFYATVRDEQTHEVSFEYNLNTITAQSKVLHGMYVTRNEEDYVFSAEVIDDIYDKIRTIETNELYWTDMF